MQALEKRSPAAIDWVDSPERTGYRPSAAEVDWLTHAGLLTARLREAHGADFRLRVLDADIGPAWLIEASNIRRVILGHADHVCIYAETHLPDGTLAAHPWLGQLGGEPLGETLKSRPDVKRGAFEFARLQPDHLPGEFVGEVTSPVWARRSEFVVGQEPLTVAEAFMPGMLQRF